MSLFTHSASSFRREEGRTTGPELAERFDGNRQALFDSSRPWIPVVWTNSSATMNAEYGHRYFGADRDPAAGTRSCHVCRRYPAGIVYALVSAISALEASIVAEGSPKARLAAGISIYCYIKHKWKSWPSAQSNWNSPKSCLSPIREMAIIRQG